MKLNKIDFREMYNFYISRNKYLTKKPSYTNFGKMLGLTTTQMMLIEQGKAPLTEKKKAKISRYTGFEFKNNTNV